MTKSEVGKLLLVIYGLERRADAPSAAVVESWHPLLWDVSLEEAVNAVHRFYGDGGNLIGVSALRSEVRKIRVEQAVPESIEDRYREPDADPDDTGAWVRALREKRFKPPGVPAVPPVGGLPLEGVGRVVPEVSREEVEDEAPRPRRWWLRLAKREVAGPEE